MPTLRNKTTDSGVIVRWKPHPKHSRPSTYQVTPRARAFFEELGYDVPSPGDEDKIPHQVCRPLRLLGDLYFESSAKDDLELGNPPTPRYYDSPSISETQLDQLRSYVKSHPSYIGGLRTGLEEELPSSPKTTPTETKPRPRIDPAAENIRTTSSGKLLLPDPFHLGKVDRLSNNRNAILQTASGREVNLGRLPKSIVGEWTVGVEYRGVWMMCLMPQVWSDGYRSDARMYIDELEELTGLDGLKKCLKIDSRRYGQDLKGRELEVYVAFAGHGLGVAYHGEWTIIIDSELVAADQRINVQIESVHGEVATATPRRPRAEAGLAEGDRVDLEVSKVGSNLLVGVHDGTQVTVPRETSVVPDRISVVITSVQDGYVVGSVAALDTSVRPTEGDVVEICEGTLPAYPTIPVSVPDVPLDESIPVRLPVANVNTDSIEVSAALLDELGVFDGDMTISSPVRYWTTQGPFILMSKIPILAENTRHLPEVRVTVRPTAFREGYVIAEFVNYDLPDSPETVESGVRQGNDYLRRGEFTTALGSFAAATDLVDVREDPATWVTTITQEVFALTATPIEAGEYIEALRLLDIRIPDLEEEDTLPEKLRENVLTELTAYRSIVEALEHIGAAAETDDGVEQTTCRQAAKKDVEGAVTLLNELRERSPKRDPHWIINKRLTQAVDGLLFPPQSATEYLVAEKTDPAELE